MKFHQVIIALILAFGVTNATFAETNALNNTENKQAISQQYPKVNLNTASVKELIKIKGIKPNHAKAIVRYRKKHGEFKSIEEIAKVKGLKKMKPDTMKQIESQLTL